MFSYQFFVGRQMLGRFFSNFTRPQTHTGVGPLRKASDVRILLDFDMFVTSSNDCGAMLPPRCPQGHFHFQEIHQDHQGIALDLKMTNCSISFWSKPNTLRSKHIEENKFGEKGVRILTPQRAKALWASYPGTVPKVAVCMQNRDGTTLYRKAAYPSYKKS